MRADPGDAAEQVHGQAGDRHTHNPKAPELAEAGLNLRFGIGGGNQNANARIAMMVGTTMASMMKTESTRIVLLAAATGPCGSSRFIGKPLSIGAPRGRA